MRSYRPEELWDADGRLAPPVAALAPAGDRRMGANPHANGGRLLRDLDLPDFRDYAVTWRRRGRHQRSDPRGRPVPARRHGRQWRQFPGHGPRRDGVQPPRRPVRSDRPDLGGRDMPRTDDHLAVDGRVMEVLSEHLCEGWLEGYLLTGRHGLFNCYEAFTHIVDSMFNQHAKWLESQRHDPWRRPIASLNYPAVEPRVAPGPQRALPPGPRLHRPRRQQARRGRAGLPAARRQLPAVHRRSLPPQPALCQRHRGRQATGAHLPGDRRRRGPLRPRHRRVGLGVDRRRADPDVVLACAGDVPTLETLAAADLLRQHFPELARPGGQRRRPHAPGTRHRTPPRSVRPGLRRPVHHRPSGHLRLPRLPVADPPPDVPADQPPQHPRPRLQGGGHDDDAVRHGDAQRPGPVPSRHGRHRPHSLAWAARPSSSTRRWSTGA